MEETIDNRLSYSSASDLMSCESKYWHRKVNKTEVDSDAVEDTLAFRIGKAFHQYLENTMHTRLDPDKMREEIFNCCHQEGVVEHSTLISAMIEAYLRMHVASGLVAVKCELPISSDDTLGFIDVILIDPKKKQWWIADLKTSARFDESVTAKLASDYQLNLYAHFAPQIGSVLPELEGYGWAGCRYRVTTKVKAKHYASVPFETYFEELVNKTVSVDVIVPNKALEPDMVYSIHEENHARILELREGVAPRRNYSNCMSYFKPCNYWSKCHGGKTFTECKSLVEVKTEEKYKLRNNAKELL